MLGTDKRMIFFTWHLFTFCISTCCMLHQYVEHVSSVLCFFMWQLLEKRAHVSSLHPIYCSYIEISHTITASSVMARCCLEMCTHLQNPPLLCPWVSLSHPSLPPRAPRCNLTTCTCFTAMDSVCKNGSRAIDNILKSGAAFSIISHTQNALTLSFRQWKPVYANLLPICAGIPSWQETQILFS